MLGVLIWLLLLAPIYGIPLGCFFLCDGMKIVKGLSRKEILGTMIVVFGCFLLTAALISQEKFVYYWDYGTYWEMSLDRINDFKSVPWEIIPRIIHSINVDDYNQWIPYIVAFPLMLFGKSYVSYILIVFVMFFVPTILSLGLLLKKVTFDYRNWNISLTWFALIICLFPWFLIPILRGYPGVLSCLAISSTLWITFNFKICNMNFKTMSCLSASLIIAALLRRYFAFYIIGYVLGIILYSFIDWLCTGHNKKELILYIKNFILLGSISLFLLLTLFQGFFLRSVFNNYQMAYAGYNTSNLFGKYKELYQHLGGLLFLFYLGALCFLISKKETRKFAGFGIGCISASTITFFQTQNMNQQHYYIITIPILTTIILGLLLYDNKYKKIIYYIVPICFFVNFIYVFSGVILPDIRGKAFFQQDRYYPKIRNDMEQLISLRTYLEQQAKDDLIYVIPGSEILNDDILRKSYLPNDIKLNLATTSYVDLRDGFPTSFFDADYVVSTTTFSTQLKPNSQRVVTILLDEMNNPDSIISKNYNRLKTFTLEQGVQAVVYKKIKIFSIDEIEYLKEKFVSIYPNNKDLFENRFDEYLKEKY